MLVWTKTESGSPVLHYGMLTAVPDKLAESDKHFSSITSPYPSLLTMMFVVHMEANKLILPKLEVFMLTPKMFDDSECIIF